MLERSPSLDHCVSIFANQGRTVKGVPITSVKVDVHPDARAVNSTSKIPQTYSDTDAFKALTAALNICTFFAMAVSLFSHLNRHPNPLPRTLDSHRRQTLAPLPATTRLSSQAICHRETDGCRCHLAFFVVIRGEPTGRSFRRLM